MRQLLGDTMQQRELNLVAQELLDVGGQALRWLEHCGANDVNVLRNVHHSCLTLTKKRTVQNAGNC